MAVPAGLPLVAAVCVCTAVLGGCSTASVATQSATTSAPVTVSTTAASATTTPRPTGSATSTVTPAAKPPYISRVQWVRGSGGRSLHIVPTSSGRTAPGIADEDEAWAEVLRLAPDADQPGMRAQFDCHWTYARIAQPDKPSWNLEPWRPVVSESQMVDARCNPGGPESAET
jgi:Protein of unknown function (DUF2599)